MSTFASVFIDDMYKTGMLHGVVVRSTIRAGRVKSISIPDLPRDYFAVREHDIPGQNAIRILDTQLPILSETDIRFAGQAIMLLCGPDDRTLDEMISAVRIEYEESEPEEFGEDYLEAQVVYERSILRGNPHKSFESAFQITEGEYISDSLYRRLVDPCGAYAIAGADGIEIVTPSRWLYHVRDSVAAVLNRDRNDVSVRMPATAGLRDGFLWNPSLVACQSALLAMASNRPVRLVLSEEEKRRLLTQKNEIRIQHKTALDKAGNLSAMHITVLADAGAYPFFGREFLDRICYSVTEPYFCPNLSVDGILLRSSSPPAESYVGFGFDTSFFSTEIHSTRLAELAGVDPYAWKKENLPAYDKKSGMNVRALLDEVSNKSDFLRKYSANEMLKKRRESLSAPAGMLRGAGMAVAYQGAGFIGGIEHFPASVRIKMLSTGELEIASSAAHREAGTPALLKLTAAELLGLKPDQIAIAPADTELVPDSGPSMLSRNVAVIRKLIQSGCQTIQGKRFRSPLPLEITKKYRKPARLKWDSDSFTGTPFTQLSSAAVVVEVEISPVTLEISVRGVWMVINAGIIIDRELAEKNVELELAQAFDWCRGYEARWENAEIIDAHFFDEQKRSSPPVSITFIEENQIQSGAIEGLAFSGFIPAFVNAVSQATGFYFDSIPVTTSLLHQYVEV